MLNSNSNNVIQNENTCFICIVVSSSMKLYFQRCYVEFLEVCSTTYIYLILLDKLL